MPTFESMVEASLLEAPQPEQIESVAKLLKKHYRDLGTWTMWRNASDEEFIKRVTGLGKAADPQPNWEHGRWLLKQWKNHLKGKPGLNLEDENLRNQVHNALVKFVRAKNANALTGDSADINQYKTSEQLEQVLAALPEDAFTSKRALKRGKVEDRFNFAGSETVAEADRLKVVKVTTPEAAHIHAAGTDWCTHDTRAAETYLEHGPLYVVYEDAKGDSNWTPLIQTTADSSEANFTDNEPVDGQWADFFWNREGTTLPSGADVRKVMEQANAADEDMEITELLDQMQSQEKIVEEFGADIDEGNIRLDQLDGSSDDVQAYGNAKAFLRDFASVAEDENKHAYGYQSSGPRVVVPVKEIFDWLDKGVIEVLQALREIKAGTWEPGREATDEFTMEMEEQAAGYYVQELESLIPAKVDNWLDEGVITEEQHEALTAAMDHDGVPAWSLWPEMQDLAYEKGAKWEYSMRDGASFSETPEDLVDYMTPQMLGQHLGIWKEHASLIPEPAGQQSLIPKSRQQSDAGQAFLQDLWQDRALRGESFEQMVQASLTEATPIITSRMPGVGPGNTDIWSVSWPDGSEWSYAVPQDHADMILRVKKHSEGKAAALVKKHGKPIDPNSRFLIPEPVEPKEQESFESMVERAVDVLSAEDRQRALDWMRNTLAKFAGSYAQYYGDEPDEDPVRLSYNSLKDGVVIQARRDEPLRPIKMTLELWAEYDPKLAEHSRPEEMTTETLVVNGEMRFPTVSSPEYSHADAKLWLEVATSEKPEELDFSSVEPYLSYTLEHEASHAVRMTGKSTSEIRHMLRGPTAVQKHPRISAEWEANLSALVSYYRGLPEEEQQTMTLSKLLQDAGFPRQARLLNAYGAKSQAWRKKLTTALAKEGVVIRQWATESYEPEPAYQQVLSILQSDDLEARKPWLEKLWPEYVNTEKPNPDNDYHVNIWGEYHQPERFGRARLPLMDLSVRLRKLGVIESFESMVSEAGLTETDGWSNRGFWILPDGETAAAPSSGHHDEAVIMWLNQNHPDQLAQMEDTSYEGLTDWAKDEGWVKVTAWTTYQGYVGFYSREIPTEDQMQSFKEWLVEHPNVNVIEAQVGMTTSTVDPNKLMRASPEGLVRLMKSHVYIPRGESFESMLSKRCLSEKVLWRATYGDGSTGALTWWAEQEEDARAYMDNPGYGGDRLYRIQANDSNVLDLAGYEPSYSRDDADMLGDLAEAVGDDSLRERYQGFYIHDVLEDPTVIAALSPQYDWVRIYDTYPEGAATWLRLSDNDGSGSPELAESISNKRHFSEASDAEQGRDANAMLSEGAHVGRLWVGGVRFKIRFDNLAEAEKFFEEGKTRYDVPKMELDKANCIVSGQLATGDSDNAEGRISEIAGAIGVEILADEYGAQESMVEALRGWVTGWLLPSGHFERGAFGEHADIAGRLLKKLDPEFEPPVEEVGYDEYAEAVVARAFRLGWVRFIEDGLRLAHDSPAWDDVRDCIARWRIPFKSTVYVDIEMPDGVKGGPTTVADILEAESPTDLAHRGWNTLRWESRTFKSMVEKKMAQKLKGRGPTQGISLPKAELANPDMMAQAVNRVLKRFPADNPEVCWNPETEVLWVSRGDWENTDNGFAPGDQMEKELSRLDGVKEVRIEYESGPPRDEEGWLIIKWRDEDDHYKGESFESMLSEASDAEQDRDADAMLQRYQSEPTNLWLYTDMPVKDRVAWAYLAADEFKKAPGGEDMLERFVASLNQVVEDPETFWQQIEKKNPKRAEYLKDAEWAIEEVPLTDIGVYPKFGGFPDECSQGNVLDTAEAIRADKTRPIKRQRVLNMTDKWMTILHFLPPILVPGGTVRGGKENYKETKYDIDDGNHRIVAAALDGAESIIAFVGKSKGAEKPEETFESMVKTALLEVPQLGMTYTPVEFSTKHQWVTEEMIREAMTKYGVRIVEIDDIPREPSKNVPKELRQLVHRFRQLKGKDDDGMRWHVKALVPDEPEDLIYDLQDVVEENFGLTFWAAMPRGWETWAPGNLVRTESLVEGRVTDDQITSLIKLAKQADVAMETDYYKKLYLEPSKGQSLVKFWIVNCDPHPRKAFGSWIAREWKRQLQQEIKTGKLQNSPDFPALGSGTGSQEDIWRQLSKFMKAKARKMLKGKQGDINSYDYKSFHDAMEEIDEHALVTKQDLIKSREAIVKAGGRTVYEKGQWLIVSGDSPDQLYELARGSGWCIKNEEYATQYLARDEPAYIVFSRKRTKPYKESPFPGYLFATAFTFSAPNAASSYEGFEWEDALDEPVDDDWISENDPGGQLLAEVQRIGGGDADNVVPYLAGKRQSPDWEDEEEEIEPELDEGNAQYDAFDNFENDWDKALEAAWEEWDIPDEEAEEVGALLDEIMRKNDLKFFQFVAEQSGIDWDYGEDYDRAGEGYAFQWVASIDWPAVAEEVTPDLVYQFAAPERWKEIQGQRFAQKAGQAGQMLLAPREPPTGFKFDVNEPVRIRDTGETGVVREKTAGYGVRPTNYVVALPTGPAENPWSTWENRNVSEDNLEPTQEPVTFESMVEYGCGPPRDEKEKRIKIEWRSEGDYYKCGEKDEGLTSFADLIERRRAPQRVVFHGTSSTFLPSIMSQGLIPIESPEKKPWGTDVSASFGSVSRASFGGIYVATGLMSASSAAWTACKKFGGDKIIVVAEVSPGSAVMDEDDLTFWVKMALGGASEHESVASDMYVAALFDDSWIQEQREKFITSFISQWSEQTGGNPQLMGRLREILEPGFMAALTRFAAYVNGRTFRRSVYSSVSANKAGYGWGNALELHPSEEEGEKAWREFINQLTHTLGFVDQPEKRSWATMRFMEPIGFSGRNHILAIYREEQAKGESGLKRTRFVRLYGDADPPEFVEQAKKGFDTGIEIVPVGQAKEPVPEPVQHESLVTPARMAADVCLSSGIPFKKVTEALASLDSPTDALDVEPRKAQDVVGAGIGDTQKLHMQANAWVKENKK